MKKLLIILLYLPIIGFGQTWSYSSGGNDFDGNYRISSVVGTGTDYPYDSPRLVVNFYENTEQINFYIDDAGYFPSNSNTSVKFSFSNEKGTIYKSKSLSYSSDRKTVFLGDFFSPNNIKKFEILQKLMSASYVNVRISNDYGRNDLKFSLNGSSRAIKYVIPTNFFLKQEILIKKKQEEEILIKKKQEEITLQKTQKRDSLLLEEFSKYSLSKSIVNQVLFSINKDKTFTDYDFASIDSLSIWKLENNLSVEVFFKYYTYGFAQVKENYKFSNILEVEEEDLVGILTIENLKNKKTKDKSTVEPIEIIKPKRKDYKSSNDYFKALREYNKKKKQ